MHAIILVPARTFNRHYRGELHIVADGRAHAVADTLKHDMPDGGRGATVEVMQIKRGAETEDTIASVFWSLGFFICRCDKPGSFH